MRVKLLVFVLIVVAGLWLGHGARQPRFDAHEWSPALLPARLDQFQQLHRYGPRHDPTRELWASYQLPTAGGARMAADGTPLPPRAASLSLAVNRQTFHDWIGCLLLQGPAVQQDHVVSVDATAQVEVARLALPTGTQIAGHAECLAGRWRAPGWRSRWHGFWQLPGTPVPTLNFFYDAPAGVTAASSEADVGLPTFLHSLDWGALERICQRQ